MRQVLILLLQIALGAALQYPLEYVYRFQSEINIGFPELKPKWSALALNGKILAQVREDGSAIFQFLEFEHGNYLGEDVACNNQEFLNITCQSVVDDFISKPFVAHLFDNNFHALQVDENEFTYSNNIKKAIVQVFKNVLLRGNFGDSEEDATMFNGKTTEQNIAKYIRRGIVPPVFTVQEESIFGICNVEYTVHNVPKSFDKTGPQMKEDSQLCALDDKDDLKKKKKKKTAKKYRKTSKTKNGKCSRKTGSKSQGSDECIGDLTKCLKLDDDIWQVVRSVDFDNCQENVYVQKSRSSINTPLNKGHYKWLRGRSSQTEYILKGSGGGFRIQKAFVQGASLINSFGVEAQDMRTVTKMEYILESVTKTSSPLSPPKPSKEVATWMEEFDVPADPPQFSKRIPFFNYIGPQEKFRPGTFVHGYPSDHFEKDVKFKKETLKSYIDMISKAMVDDTGINNSHYALYLGITRHSVFLMQEFTKAELKELADLYIIDPFTQEEIMARKLFIDLLAETGTRASIQLILNLLEEDEIDLLQQLTIFSTIFTKVYDPNDLPLLMDHVLDMSMDIQPIETSTALVSLAHALMKLCINLEAHSVYTISLGENDCKKHTKEKFLPHILHLLKEEKALWKKKLAIRVASSLKTPFMIPHVIPIIYGQSEIKDLTIRVSAVTLLERWNLPYYVRNQVIDILTGIYTEYTMHPSIREAALYALVQWEPSTHVWHRLARQTWREPSRKVLLLTTAVIRSLATSRDTFFKNQNQAASHAIKFMKPISLLPMSERVFYYREVKQNLEAQSYRIREGGWVHYDDKSLFAIFDEISDSGYHLQLYEMLLIIQQSWKDSSETLHPDSKSKRLASLFYDKIQEYITAQTIPESSESPREEEFEVYAKFMENIIAYLPLNSETKDSPIIPDALHLGTIAGQMTSVGYNLVLGKFINPIDLSLLLPTELGVPAVSMVMSPMLFGLNSLTKGEISLDGPMPELKQLKSNIALKIMSSVSTDMTVCFPYATENIGASVSSMRQLNLPFYLSYHPTDNKEHKITLESMYEKEFLPVVAENIPLVHIYPTFTEHQKNYRFKIVGTPKDASIDNHFLGVSSKLIQSKGFTVRDLVSASPLNEFPDAQFLLTSPTAKYWKLGVSIDPSKSETKSLTFVFTKFKKECKKKDPQQEDQYSQYDQETGDYDYGPEFDQKYGEIEQFGQTTQQQSGSSEKLVYEPEATQVENQHFGYNLEIKDTFQQRHKKLESFGELLCKNIRNYRIEANAENQKLVYDFVITSWNNYGNDTQKTSKLNFVYMRYDPFFGNNALKVCGDFSVDNPVLRRLSISDPKLSERLSNLRSSTSLILYENCQNAPIFGVENKMTFHYHQKFIDSLKDKCDLKPDDPFQDDFVFDSGDVQFFWNPIKESNNYPFVNRIIDVLSISASFPEDTCRRSSGKVTPLHLHRCPKCRKWALHSGYGSFKYSLSDENSRLLDNVYRISNGKNFFLDYESPADSSKKCFIDHNSVNTFDGLSIPFTPTTCWTVAAMDCSEEDNEMVLIRQSEESTIPEARFISKKNGIVIDVSDHVKVNGKDIYPIGDSEKILDEDGQMIANVYVKGNVIVVETQSVKIVCTDQLVISLRKSYKGKSCGLCGNYNGENYYELIGPHRCIYENPKDFAASWTGPSRTCDVYELLSLREKAENYQKHCETIDTVLENAPSYRPSFGIHFEWIVLKDNPPKYICVSYGPIAGCSEGYQPLVSQAEEVNFSCYYDTLLPPALRKAVDNNKHFITEPVDGVPQMSITREILVPTSCVQEPEFEYVHY